ncbi:MAG: SPFH/Band 7/PHB domain protein, partial [Desulfurococcaceae archaeon]
EGKRTSAILEAEGQREAMIKKGEGEKQYEILVAEGKARALELIQEAASKLGPNALLLQYLDALKSVAQSPSTKIVIPLELMTGFSRIMELFVPRKTNEEVEK